MRNWKMDTLSCSAATETTLAHIKEEAAEKVYNPEQLALKIDQIRKEVNVLEVVKARWQHAENEAEKQPIMEETTQQKGEAQ